MLFERIVSEGLAHNSYLIGSGSDAAVIDPRRDCGIYCTLARKNGMTIRHIFETHRNEDYVSGAPGLAGRCGAAIWHGAALPFAYGNPAREGDRFTLGGIEIEVIETPGHTGESISLVVRETSSGDTPLMIFSGDTLFAGAIARTDFFGRERDAEMAGLLYASITEKILPLGDGVILCPAHGAGSVCGENIADRPFTTAGYEKATNPLLRMGREAFVRQRVAARPYTPPYFRRMEVLNRDGAPLLPQNPAPPLLGPGETTALLAAGGIAIDIRSPTAFAAGHIPGSISIWENGLAGFLGWAVDYAAPLVIVDDVSSTPCRAVRSFLRLGFDNLAGILAGGFPAWAKAAGPVGTIGTCTVRQLKDRLDGEEPFFLLDVRDIRHWQDGGHIPGAHHLYAGEVPTRLSGIPETLPVVTICDAGFKGSFAASLLARAGYNDVTNVLGGMTAWYAAGLPAVR